MENFAWWCNFLSNPVRRVSTPLGFGVESEVFFAQGRMGVGLSLVRLGFAPGMRNCCDDGF